MKSRDVKSQTRRREERRSKKRKSQKKEDPGVRKGGKVAAHCVFPMICGVRRQVARWEMKNCPSLWREAHLQVKMYKAHQRWTIFRSCDVEKVHAVVARSTFASKKAESTSRSERLWKLRRRKGARRCGMLWREALFEVKMHITHHARTTFGSWNVQKVYAVVARSTFRSKRHMFAPLLDVQMLLRLAGARDCAPCLQICWDDFAWQVQHFVWPGITFLWQAPYCRQVELEKSQNALVRGRQLCTQLSIFEGSLAELFRFWCCQLRKLRKSGRVAAFSSLQIGR